MACCIKWQSAAPPPRSSGRSPGGGCTSPANPGDASTASLFASCPEDAVWWQQGPRVNQLVRCTCHIPKCCTQNVSLFSQEVCAESDHPKHDVNHLLHHKDFSPQIVLLLLSVPVHSNVEALIKLRTHNQGVTLHTCGKKIKIKIGIW